MLSFAQRWSQRDLQRQLTTKGEADGTSCEGGIELPRPANDLLSSEGSSRWSVTGGRLPRGSSATSLLCSPTIPTCPITFSTPWWWLPPHRISYEWNLMTSWSRAIGSLPKESILRHCRLLAGTSTAGEGIPKSRLGIGALDVHPLPAARAPLLLGVVRVHPVTTAPFCSSRCTPSHAAICNVVRASLPSKGKARLVR